MPEGDTIYKLAAVLAPALEGRPLARLWTRDRGDVAALIGARVERVEARGKHMLITFGSGPRVQERWVLRVHLGMHGRWYRDAPPAAGVARVPTGGNRSIVLASDRDVLVCYRAAQVELRRAGDLVLERRLQRLGPDLLAPTTELSSIVARARSLVDPGREAGDILLDQRVAAGIGNVYKSEVLFLERIHPRRRLATLGDEDLLGLYRTAAELLRSNTGPGWRATTGTLRGSRRRPDTSRVWVYRRAGLPCLRCGTFIERIVQGDMARSTYWCPSCQRLPAG